MAFGAAGLLAQVLVPYRRYAGFLRWSTLALFAYVAAAFAVDIDWRAALRGALLLTTAATLNAHGVSGIDTAAQAAEALRPLAGDFAFFLFALGIIGAGLLAIPVLAGSAAYAVSDVIGGRFSLEAPFARAPGFYGIVILATLLGAALDFTSIPPMQMLLRTALLNGIIAPPFLFAMMIVAGNARAMGAHVSPKWVSALGWIATAAMTFAILLLAISTFAFDL